MLNQMGINFKGFAVQVQWLFIVPVAWLLVETKYEIGIALASGHFDDDVESSSKFNRSCFPKGFIFGTAAAAYQVLIVMFSQTEQELFLPRPLDPSVVTKY